MSSVTGWRLAELGGNTLAVEWADAPSGAWVDRLLGLHPHAPTALPSQVYRLHQTRTEPGLTVFAGQSCLYRGPDALRGVHALMESMMDTWSLGCSSGLMLHAALVARQGRGLLISGASGAGKSTLAAWLLLNGWVHHGDEQSCVPAAGEHWQGFVRPLCFKGNWQAVFAGLLDTSEHTNQNTAGNMSEPLPTLAGQTLVPPGLFGQHRPPERAVQPGLILLPSFQAGAPLALQRLSAGRAAMRLVPALLNGGKLRHRGIPQLAELARKAPAFELTYGHFDQLPALLPVLDAAFAELPS